MNDLRKRDGRAAAHQAAGDGTRAGSGDRGFVRRGHRRGRRQVRLSQAPAMRDRVAECCRRGRRHRRVVTNVTQGASRVEAMGRVVSSGPIRRRVRRVPCGIVRGRLGVHRMVRGRMVLRGHGCGHRWRWRVPGLQRHGIRCPQPPGQQSQQQPHQCATHGRHYIAVAGVPCCRAPVQPHAPGAIQRGRGPGGGAVLTARVSSAAATKTAPSHARRSNPTTGMAAPPMAEPRAVPM